MYKVDLLWSGLLARFKHHMFIVHWECWEIPHIDGLVQERRNSIVKALKLRLSCTNPSICNSQYVTNQLLSIN